MGVLPESTMVYLIISLILCIVGPIGFAIFNSRKAGISTKSMLAGVIVYIVFVLIGGLLDRLFVKEGNFIDTNMLAYAIYRSLSGGVIQVLGCFFGMKVIVKSEKSPAHALHYGIGYGIIGCTMIGTMTLLNNITLANQLKKVGYDGVMELLDPVSQQKLESSIEMLYKDNYVCLLSGIEKLIGFALTIAISVIVYQSIKTNGKKIYLVYGLVAYFVANFVTGLYCRSENVSIIFAECWYAIVTIAVCVFAFVLYKKNVEEFGAPINEKER